MNAFQLPSTSRRSFLALSAAAATGIDHWAAAAQETPVPQPATPEPFKYCLNTSTISGQNLSIEKEIEIAAKAGFTAIEPWIRELETFQSKGGKLSDLKKRLDDHGLVVADAIGFAPWIVDDPAERAKGLEQARREMDWVRQIGGSHIAAPPAGAQDHPGPPLDAIAERYRALLEAGARIGVTPVLELWGFSKTLSRIGEVAYVAGEARHPNSCILLDIYHLYKGGSDFDSLHLLAGDALPVLHTNDYPAAPPRETITDASRVYPGDGVAPLKQIFQTLRRINFRGYLSVELFNHAYWKENPQKVANEALAKTRDSVAKALG